MAELLSNVPTAEHDDEEEDFELDDDDLPLPSLFSEMRVIYERLNGEGDIPSNDTEENKVKAFERAFTLLEKIGIRLRSNGIFSPNEELDDISTSNIKYLMVDYYRGKLFPKAISSSGGFDPGQRFRALKKSRVCYFAFLSRCENHRTIFNDLEKDCYEMLTIKTSRGENEDEEEEEEGQIVKNRMKSSDPNKERTNKIERFKYQREEKQKLAEVQSNLMVNKKNDRNLSDNDQDDSDDVRDKEIILLHLAINDALDEVLGINQELTMLEMMMSRSIGGGSGSNHSHSHSGGGGSHAEEGSTCGHESHDNRINQQRYHSRHGSHHEGGGMTQVVGVGSGGGSIVYDAKDPNRPGLQVTHFNKDSQGLVTSRKEQIKAGVFQPGHRLPTMTLEELAEIEVREAMERAERQKNAPPPPRRIKQLEDDGDEDNAQLVDEASYRDRDWDNFKDENPKGSGNKANKRY